MKLSFFKIIAFISVVIIFSCSRNHSTENRKTGKLIASYTQGTVSPQTDITVTFTKPFTIPLNDASKQLQGIFQLKPGVKGKTWRSGEKSVSFQPDNSLKFNTSYMVTVDLGKLYKNPETDDFTFEIKTLPLSVQLEKPVLKPLSPSANRWNRALLRFRFSDAIDSQSALSAVTVTQNKKQLPLSISGESQGSNLVLVADSVERQDGKSSIVVSLDLKQLKGEGTRQWEFPVPAANVFRFEDYVLHTDKNGALDLIFSDRLDKDQNLQGLIYFEDNTPVTLEISENRITLYPKEIPDGQKTLIIDPALQNFKGVKLKERKRLDIYFKPADPQVDFLREGTILVSDGKTLLPFKSINLNAVDVLIFKIYANNVRQFLQVNSLSGDWQMDRVGEFVHHEKIVLHDPPLTNPVNKWESYALDLSKMVNTDPGSIYRVYLRFKKSYAALSCANNGSGTEDDNESETEEDNNYYQSNYYYPENYRWSQSKDPCKDSYYYYDHFREKNVAVSNIGLSMKNSGPETYSIYTTHLITGKPMSGVKVILYNYQQQEIARGKTGDKGYLSMKTGKKPALAVATDGHQFTYLRTKAGNALSYSRFDTKGIKAENGVKGYIYGERGVWRPGDTIFLGFVLKDENNTIPQGHPFTLRLFNAREKQVYNTTGHYTGASLYTFRIPTRSDDPTGVWNVRIKLGGNLFTKRIRVENIKPNRLKITLEAKDGDMLRRTGSDKGTIKAVWLSGGAVSGLKAVITEKVETGTATFKEYRNYVFDDPSQRFYPDVSNIFDDKLGRDGSAEFNFFKPAGGYLPSMLRINLVAKVFEPGGGFSIDQKTWKYAPHEKFIGIKAPVPGDGKWLETDKDLWFDIITLSSDGKPVRGGNLRLEVYKLDWSWWYSNDEGLNYVERNYKNRIIDKPISLPGSKGKFKIHLKYPEWGRYLVRVTDKNSGSSSGVVVYIDWPDTYARDNRSVAQDATVLSITTDKKSYHPGDTITVSFPAPENSTALISLEKNNRQIKWWWDKSGSKAGEKAIRFVADGSMAPNVYVSVSLIQPHAQTVNDLPLRMYGVVPVPVEDPGTVLHPVIEVPGTIRPLSDYTVKVSEKSGRKMEYTLAVVDEGLLDLTHYKTPDPHGRFFSKEALAVKTWDIYDDVAGAVGATFLQRFAVGGDEELEPTGKKKVNRFKPVVTFLGPFTLKAGETVTHTLKMKNYIGAVRVMVVASSHDAYGKAEQHVNVKQPLMVLSSLPRILAPGETLQLPVTVFALDESIKDVTVSLKTNDLFVVETGRQTVHFDKPGDKIVFFTVKTSGAQGKGEIRAEVSANGEKAVSNTEVAVRNPNKRQYQVDNVIIAAGDTWKGNPSYPPNSENKTLEMTLSYLPSLNIESRLGFLIHYPYGCVEQTVSSVFPQLFLEDIMELEKSKKEEITSNITVAIDKLRSFQNSDGGFSYWPGLNAVSGWGSSYAGHFLLLAKDAGYFVPSGMISDWINYQRSASRRWDTYYYNKRLINGMNQAYRLYTLALAGKPDIQAMNRLRETGGLSREAKFRLAAAYALIKQAGVAQQLINDAANALPEDRRSYRFSFGSDLRDEAMMLETYTLINDIKKAFVLYKAVAGKLGSDHWYSTQTTAYALYAAARFAKERQQDNTELNLTWKWQGKTHRYSSRKALFTTQLTPEDDKLKITNNGSKDIFLTLTTSGIPVAGQKKDAEENVKMEVEYFTMDNKPVDVTELKQGTDFFARVTVANTGHVSGYDHMALGFAVPSGWEIINTRLWDVDGAVHSSKPDYMDIRDDGVNYFFGLQRGQKKHFVILLNAAYPGTFQAPLIHAEEMYDHSIRAVKGGSTVEVYR